MRAIKRPIDREENRDRGNVHARERERERWQFRNERGCEERGREKFALEICGSHSVSSYTQIVPNDFN